MSLTSDAICHARTIRDRLRNPPNAVPDDGIDLKRPPKTIPVVNIEAEQQPAPQVEIEPVEPAITKLSPHQQIEVLEKQIEQLRHSLGPDAPPKRIRIDDIRAKVATYFGFTAGDLQSQRRDAKVVRARQIACYLSRKMTPASWKRIAIMFGRRDHTTVLYSVRKIEMLRARDPQLDVTLRGLESLISS